MSDCLVCPECPSCGARRQKLRFDPDRHIGVVRCQECVEDIFVVSLLANKHVTTVKDPVAGDLPEETYESLKEKGRLPPVAEREEVGGD
jgi:hypothetical protein